MLFCGPTLLKTCSSLSVSILPSQDYTVLFSHRRSSNYTRRNEAGLVLAGDCQNLNSEAIFEAITEFPRPTLPLLFSLVEEVVWSFLKSAILLKFWEILLPMFEFILTPSLPRAVEEA